MKVRDTSTATSHEQRADCNNSEVQQDMAKYWRIHGLMGFPCSRKTQVCVFRLSDFGFRGL